MLPEQNTILQEQVEAPLAFNSNLNSNAEKELTEEEAFVKFLKMDGFLESETTLEKKLVSIAEINTEKLNRVLDLDIRSLLPYEEQPRKNFDETSLRELSQSISNFGILQPLIVTATNSNTFKIIAGERRWRAAKVAGLTHVPCLVRKYAENNSLEVALIENIQREDLSPIDEARAYQKLIELHDYTQELLAARIGKDRSTVANFIRILGLPEEVISALEQKQIAVGHAKALCAVEDEKLQIKVKNLIISKKLSVRQTEDYIKNLRKEELDPKPLVDKLPPDLRKLCDEIKGHLGTKVKISGSIDKGKIEISYFTTEDLERIADLVLGIQVQKSSSQKENLI